MKKITGIATQRKKKPVLWFCSGISPRCPCDDCLHMTFHPPKKELKKEEKKNQRNNAPFIPEQNVCSDSEIAIPADFRTLTRLQLTAWLNYLGAGKVFKLYLAFTGHVWRLMFCRVVGDGWPPHLSPLKWSQFRKIAVQLKARPFLEVSAQRQTLFISSGVAEHLHFSGHKLQRSYIWESWAWWRQSCLGRGKWQDPSLLIYDPQAGTADWVLAARALLFFPHPWFG